MLFFSDAVFAIAITLLVVDIRVPAGTAGAIDSARVLQDATPQMIGMAISFLVIGQFWMGHHAISRHIVAFNRRLIALNLLFLATIAFLPYPTALLSAATSQTPALIFYAASVSAAGLAESGVLGYAMRSPTLVHPDTPRVLQRYLIARTLRLPVVFLASVPVAVFAPAYAPYVWILAALTGIALRRVMLRQAPAAAAGDEDDPP